MKQVTPDIPREDAALSEIADSSASELQTILRAERRARIAQVVGDVALDAVSMAAGAAITYGALKSGYLDGIPAVAGSSADMQVGFSLMGAFAGSLVYRQTRALVRGKKNK